MFENRYPYTDFHELNLDWVLEQLKKLGDNVKAIEEYLDQFKDDVQFVEDLYNAISAGDLPEAWQRAFENWMRNNAVDLVGELVHNVFFGLTQDGYFVAYIPESWDDITFGTTGLDDFPAGIPYGHLTLTY